MIGLGTGTGVGVSTLVSRALGRRDGRQASRVAGIAVFLSVCCWALMALFGVFGADVFIHSQTDLANIHQYADDYLRIVTIGSLFLYLEVSVERLLQSTGLTRLSMWTQMIGAVTNIILDPFFIFGWCGLPAMGTAGAAIATVIGQSFAAAAGFFFSAGVGNYPGYLQNRVPVYRNDGDRLFHKLCHEYYSGRFYIYGHCGIWQLF